jgi:lipopolysaccharide exporter
VPDARRSIRPGAIVREAIASPFARGVAVLVSGTAIGYALTALVSPILSRVFDPAAFGLLALFSSVLSILAEAATGRYELAIVLPKRDEEGANLLALTALVVCAAALVTLLAVAVAGGAFARLLGDSDFAPFLWWVPPALLVVGLGSALSHWLTRRRDFRGISAMQIYRSAGAAAVQVATGLTHAGAAGLIAGRVAGEALGLGGIALHTRREDRALIRRVVRLSEIRRLARAYADFPKFSMPQGLINAISQSVPAFLLSAYFDVKVVGLYAMGHRLLYLPSRFLGQSVRQVYLQKASDAHAHGVDLHRLFTRTTLGLIAIGVLPALAVVLFGPWLFRVALGPNWGEAGVYAQWMVLWLFFGFINPPATVLMQVLRLQRQLLVFDITLLIARCAALWVGGTFATPLVTIALFSIVGALFNAALPVALWIHTRRLRARAATGAMSDT